MSFIISSFGISGKRLSPIASIGFPNSFFRSFSSSSLCSIPSSLITLFHATATISVESHKVPSTSNIIPFISFLRYLFVHKTVFPKYTILQGFTTSPVFFQSFSSIFSRDSIPSHGFIHISTFFFSSLL